MEHADAVFVSDVHLSAEHAGTTEAFVRFLDDRVVGRTPRLYILGDLFEYWAGDDDLDDPVARSIVGRLRALADSGIALGFMAGNRDFLIGEAFAQAAGMTILPDPSRVAIEGVELVLSHGDALCIDDVAYQRYRSVVRYPVVQRLFGALPLTMRRGIGAAMRRRSGRREPRPEGGYADVDSASALSLLRDAHAPTLVHGHTHAPATHVLAPGVVRHVLSDWELDSSSAPRAEVMRWSAAGFERIEPRGSATHPAVVRP
jgi:UDP-2,3-diacylglucosamine hydrolase